MVEVAAITACGILAGLTIFQLALIFGAPIGKFAWGGAHAILPTNLRIGSAISVLLYVLFAVIILSRSGLAALIEPQLANVGIWVLAAYFSLGVVMNAISRSKSERNLMTPVALMLALLTVVVAAS